MAKVRGKIKVLHYVWWHNAHIAKLILTQRAQGIDARQSRALIPASILRILLAPFSLIAYRLLGFQIIHLHWIAGHFKPANSKSILMARLYFAWFKLFLQLSHLLGLKVVWTAHNLLPHDPVFLNDVLARKYLVSHADEILALNSTSLAKLKNEFGATAVTEIPVAEVIPVPTENRDATRLRLGVQPNELLFSHFGHIRPYKGADKFLAAIQETKPGLKFLLAGGPGAADYMETIHSLRDSALRVGAKLDYQEGFLNQGELANLIQASDFLVCPFEAINNSGFVNIAFAMGVPVILSDVDGLSWIPRSAAIWISPENDVKSLAQTINESSALTHQQISTIVESAAEFSHQHGWDSYVLPQVESYIRLTK